MALFTVDSQNTLGKSVREAGSYNVRILDDSECKPTKKTHNDMAVLNYEVIDGKYKGGKILYDNIVWDNSNIELSIKRFNTLLAAIGVPDGTSIESIQHLVGGVIGRDLNITVDWDRSEHNGKWNLKVKGYSKLDKEGSKPNGVERPAGEAKQGALSGVDPMKDLADPFASNNSALNISDDDLPF